MLPTLSVMGGVNPNKRVRKVYTPTGNIPDLNDLPKVDGYSKSDVEHIISSFLSLPDLPLSTIGDSFEEELDKFFGACSDETVQYRGFQLASFLQECAQTCSRKRLTVFNSKSWPLPLELTVKVLSKLDTKSLMQAFACCTMFKKCAMDPLSYSEIDLTTANVDNDVVCSMILNAKDELRSLKVGTPNPVLTGSCLTPLSHGRDYGFLGNILKILHIYNHGRWLDNEALCGALSVCSNLTDLKIVGVNMRSLSNVLDLVKSKCEHLFLQKDDVREKQTAFGREGFYSGWAFERKCPNIASLSLIGFDLSDRTVYLLIKGLPKLKHINVSKSFVIDGCFLRDVSRDCKDSLLESLVLQNCSYLKKKYISQFMDSLMIGHFGFFRRIDLSNNYRFLDDSRRLPVEELKERRPDVTVVFNMRHFRPSASSSSSSVYSSSYSSGDASSSASTD